MHLLSLVGWIGLCFAVAGLGGLWTDSQRAWYRALRHPSITPPSWVFGPVWSLMYLLMAIAAWLVWQTPASPRRTLDIVLFLVQLALNFGWTWVFFRLHAIAAALVEIVLLWLAIAATLVAFSGLSHIAAWLLAPYLAWVSLATVLNLGFWRLNRAASRS